MMDSDKYSLHTKETIDFFWATRDSDWNLGLNSKIINFLDLDIKKKLLKLKILNLINIKVHQIYFLY